MTLPQSRPLPNAADKAALKAIATTIIQTCPSLHDTAHEVASELLKKHGLTELDPDKVYYHRFKAAQSSSRTFTGWEHVGEPASIPLTLTQLVIQRFRVTDQDNADLLDLYGGFYTAGPQAGNFDETNEVRLHANQVLKDIWNIDFSDLYARRLSAFWDQNGDNFRTLAKCNFLIQAVRARETGQLSDADFQFVTHAVTGPITWPMTLQQLRAQTSDDDTVRALDIAGYVATNVLRIVNPKGRQILYLPGETDAFQVLKTETDMHYWMFQRMNEDTQRHHFMTHFRLADRQEIAGNLQDLMNRLMRSWSRYDHRMINQKNLIIRGDPFTWLTHSTQDALLAEAKLCLTTNSDLRKKLWIGYLSAGLKVFGPMAVVGAPIALAVIGASIASLGLNIDQAVNGKTAQERDAGTLSAVFSGIDMLFNLLFIKVPGPLPEVGAEVEAAEAREMAELAEGLQPGDPVNDAQGPAPDGTGDADSLSSSPEDGANDESRPEADGVVPLSEASAPTLAPLDSAPMVPEHWQANELLESIEPVSEPGPYQGIYRLDSDPVHRHHDE